MIIRLLLKNWKLLLDIALILALIFLIFLWNPANIFGNGLKLRHTANMVSEIKEIGELITAEYYGEVIASDEESMLGILNVDSIELQAMGRYISEVKTPLFDAYITASRSVYEAAAEKKFLFAKGEERYIRNQLVQIKSDIVKERLEKLQSKLKDDQLNALLLFIATYEHGNSLNQNKFIRKSENQKGNYTNKILKEILETEYDQVVHYANGDADFQGYLSQGFTTNYRYTDFYFDYMEQSLPRKEQKVEIALIGRGSVKAGFRFDQLDERNVVYDAERQYIYLYGFNAEILYQDINPWFIPERQVPGYQIIMAKNASFEKMKELKLHCLDKLTYQAELAGIRQQAQKNGEVAIAEFFSLLLGEDIKKVVFSNDPLGLESASITKDSLISPNELVLIDSLIQQELISIEGSEEPIKQHRKKLLAEFIADLSQYEVCWKNKRLAFNYFNRHIPAILEDTMVTSLGDELPSLIDYTYTNDLELIKKLRSTFSDSVFQFPEMYSLWSTDSLAYFKEYNDFLSILQEYGTEYCITFLKKEPLKSQKSYVMRQSDTIRTSLVSDSHVYFYELVRSKQLDSLKFRIDPGINFTDDFILTRMTKDSIDAFLNRFVDEEPLKAYLLSSKQVYDEQDNGFKRFRRSLQANATQSNSMNNIREKIDSWAQEVRSEF